MINLNSDANVVVFIIVTAVLASTISFGTLIHTVADQQFSMSHRILLDNSEGNTMGWNPKGNRIFFTIFDDQFNTETPTVIVNTFRSNFVVCNVDFMYNGAFEVNCNNAPANAG